MRNKMFLALLGFTLFLSLVTPINVYANSFYSWFEKGQYYGIWANISTPATAPSTPSPWTQPGYFTHINHIL